jgi:hypothetical protein
MERGTTPGHVDAVGGIDDRVLRNYWVTQTYSDLAAGLSAVLEASTANWCTFGTWASCTVGRNLRGEDLPDWLHRRVVTADGMMGVTREARSRLRQGGLDRWLHDLTPRHVAGVVQELFGACARNLSDGNTEVFAEIAPAAATFLDCFARPPADRAAARARVAQVCRGAPRFEGRNRLHDGFMHWCDALEAEDAVRRSQLILAGSLSLGAHEQHHLQGAIEGSMDMGVNQSLAALRRRVAKDDAGLARVEDEVDRALHPVSRAIDELWGDVMTELLGTIVTPEGTLRLNRDVPALPDGPFRPPEFDVLVVDDLAHLLSRFNRAGPDGSDSRAPDWSSLDDRMNFIANLFLSRHHRTELFAPPFAPPVLAALEADRVPPPEPSTAGRPGPDAADRPPIPASRGLAQFTDAFVEQLRQTGDPPADAAVEEFFAATQAEHTHLFRRLARAQAGERSDEELPGIGPFVEALEPWPDWADPRLVAEGQRLFGDYGLQLGMGLFMASLPSDYAFGKGVQALSRTARLTRDPKRRYVETGQMIIDAMTPGGLDPGAPGYRAVRHVRLMHAAVRHVLGHLDEIEVEGPPIAPWDPAFGLPISQLQLLGTQFSFSVEGVKALRRSGVRVSDRQAEAYIHVWNLVGHQIGVGDDLLPLSWPDSLRLWEERRKKEYQATPEGRELTAAAIECMNELFGFSHLPGLPATGIRHYLGNETADTLGVPKADWTRVIFELMSRTDGLYQLALVRLPGTAPVASVLGRRLWRGFELYGRSGQRPSFEVSGELRDAWGM